MASVQCKYKGQHNPMRPYFIPSCHSLRPQWLLALIRYSIVKGNKGQETYTLAAYSPCMLDEASLSILPSSLLRKHL